MSRVFFAAAKRTPVGRFGGALASLPASQLAAHTARACLDEVKLDPAVVDSFIMGNVLMAGQGMGPARQASLEAGLPVTVPAHTLNMICGSGMKAVMDAAMAIRVGDADVVLAVGAESMSQAPFYLPASTRFGNKYGQLQVQDAIQHDGLTDAFNQYAMGITAENLARRYDLSRSEQDSYALRSQQRAVAAQQSGCFDNEIVPIEVKQRKGKVLVSQDESPREGLDISDLERLRPAFESEGTVTAANASSMNDGAAALLLVSEHALEKYQLEPLAELVADAQVGVEPDVMGIGPAPAIDSVLRKAKMTLTDVGLLELNEAFAAQTLAVNRELQMKHQVTDEWLEQRVNLSGGAIALGHPLGASGARILVTLLHSMQRREVGCGIASLCIGGGMGTAVLVKR